MANIKNQIKILIDIQKIDTEIYALTVEMQHIPAIIQLLENEFKARQDLLKMLSDKVKAAQLKQKEKELELSTKEAVIKKSQNQLYSLKTNKEYQAKLLEIEGIKAECSLLEEAIIKILEGIDSLNQEIKIEKEKLGVQEKAFLEEKKKYEIRIKEIEDRLNVLQTQRKGMASNIEVKLLNQYEKVLHNREGLGIAGVENFACQGCHMGVAPQVVNEIKMNDFVIICPACQRILYLLEE